MFFFLTSSRLSTRWSCLFVLSVITFPPFSFVLLTTESFSVSVDGREGKIEIKSEITDNPRAHKRFCAFNFNFSVCCCCCPLFCINKFKSLVCVIWEALLELAGAWWWWAELNSRVDYETESSRVPLHLIDVVRGDDEWKANLSLEKMAENDDWDILVFRSTHYVIR